MTAEIQKIMTDLGLRYDQAYRMVRQRREFDRRRPSGVSNWFK